MHSKIELFFYRTYVMFSKQNTTVEQLQRNAGNLFYQFCNDRPDPQESIHKPNKTSWSFQPGSTFAPQHYRNVSMYFYFIFASFHFASCADQLISVFFFHVKQSTVKKVVHCKQFLVGKCTVSTVTCIVSKLLQVMYCKYCNVYCKLSYCKKDTIKKTHGLLIKF